MLVVIPHFSLTLPKFNSEQQSRDCCVVQTGHLWIVRRCQTGIEAGLELMFGTTSQSSELQFCLAFYAQLRFSGMSEGRSGDENKYGSKPQLSACNLGLMNYSIRHSPKFLYSQFSNCQTMMSVKGKLSAYFRLDNFKEGKIWHC